MVKVPKELKIKYLSRRLADIHDVRESLQYEDYALAQRIGHQIKGNAVTFEVPQIASLGHEIEAAAKKKDKDKIGILISRMEQLLVVAQKSSHF
jgi:HPt (histidine-containing phosphotransfer) domain-containing protein